MATLISGATGNFTAAGTWKVSNATALLSSEAGNTALTTSYVGSTAFTPGAITIDAIAVKIASRSASPTGTMSVELYNSTGAASVAGTAVTIDVSDIANVSPTGWAVFVFSAPVVLLPATNYQVRAKTSSSSQVNLYRDATANNWSRHLRTTATAAPAASDILIIAGEFVAADQANSFVVTMDSTSSATTYGQIDLCRWAAFNYGIAASTNYYLKLAGDLNVYAADAFTMGTLANPIPSTSTAKLEFACSSNVQYGLVLKTGGSVTTYGTSKTISAELTADAAIAATSLTTGTSTGWLNGDQIAIAATTRTANEAEKKTLSANASGTTLTIAALTNAHSGTGTTKAKLLNLTRNVSIFSTSTTNNTYIVMPALSFGSFNNTEFYNMGSATANKRGIDVATSSGAYFIGCAIHDFTASSVIGINIAANVTPIQVQNTVFYGIAGNSIIIAAGTGTSNVFNNISSVRTTGGLPAFNFGTLKSPITSIYANGVASASSGSISLSDTTITTFPTLSGFEACGSGGSGVVLNSITPAALLSGKLVISSITAWRCSSDGVIINATHDTIVNGITAFGNTGNNVNVSTASDNLELKSMDLNAGTTLTCAVGMNISSQSTVKVFDSTFGSTTTHATGDLSIGNSGFLRVQFYNCTFSSSTEIASQTTISRSLYMDGIGSSKHDGVAGAYKAWKRYSTNSLDTTLFKTLSPSLRITPNNASFFGTSAIRKILVPSGQAGTVSVWVRKSNTGAGDASTYNGSVQPQIVLLSDPSVGVTADTVLATATAASNGAWELLTGTLPTITANSAFTIYLQCNGTVGWVNFDDFSTNVATIPSGMLYWVDAAPDYSAGGPFGSSSTFS